MIQNDFKYPYALDLCKRINTICIGEKGIQEYFMYEGYNFWQAYQSDIFVYAKRYSANPYATVVAITVESNFSVLRSLLGLIFSIFAYIKTKIRGSSILVYSLDKKPQGRYACDFRLQELYEALDSTNMLYTEVLYTSSASSILRNVRTTHRLAFYTCGIDLYTWCKFFFKIKKYDRHSWNSTERFTEDEKIFIDALLYALYKKFSYVDMRVQWFKKILLNLKIKKIFLIDDMRNYFELLCAARMNGVVTIALQHGHFTKYHIGIIPFSSTVQGDIIMPDNLFVWNEYWKNELQRLGTYYPSKSIFIAGRKGTIVDQKKLSQKRKTGNIGVLIPYETDVPKHAIREYIMKLKEYRDIVIYFKPRTDVDIEQQLTQYGLHNDDIVKICLSVPDSIEYIHVAFGTYTTFLYDMIEYDIPILLAPNVLDYGEGMIKNRLANAVTEPSFMYQMIYDVARHTDIIELQRRKNVYGFDAVLHMKKTLQDILNEEGYNHVL